jgi:hypothetical protein
MLALLTDPAARAVQADQRSGLIPWRVPPLLFKTFSRIVWRLQRCGVDGRYTFASSSRHSALPRLWSLALTWL